MWLTPVSFAVQVLDQLSRQSGSVNQDAEDLNTRYLLALARELKVSLAELRRMLSLADLAYWMAYFRIERQA
jgi:hypothetical protein